MTTTDPRIDAYISKAPDFAKPILIHLRNLLHTACPEIEETWKWSFPVFVYKGAILCNMAAFKAHCSFGFWKAALLQDSESVLTIKDRDGMGHLGKITTLKDLPNDAVLKKYIKAAMRLNEAGIKVQPKSKVTEKEKQEFAIPVYFTKALKSNKAAKTVFDAFSYSNKKDYVEWFEEAKTDATRDKRIVQAIEWIAEGKSRHWKYKNC